MTEIKTILSQLEEASHAGTLKRYDKIGETKPYYGVPMGALSKIAKTYINQSDLFVPLWQTGILEAQYLAIQIVKNKPDQLVASDLKSSISKQVSHNVLDKLASLILSKRREAKTGKNTYSPKTKLFFNDLDGSFGPNILLEKPLQTKKLNKHLLISKSI